MPRHYRRSAPGAVTKSYKKIIDEAPASRVAATIIDLDIVLGVDGLAPGQGTATDVTVPTGSIIKAINIDVPFGYTGTATAFVWISIQHLHANQSTISTRVVGGNPQRNQVHFQQLFMIGENQNHNFHKLFKIPRRFQRVRDGDRWVFSYQSDVAHASGMQAIYKIYS